MVHDDQCELKLYRTAMGCRCAQRAYDKDPLPDVRPPWGSLDDHNFDEWMSH